MSFVTSLAAVRCIRSFGATAATSTVIQVSLSRRDRRGIIPPPVFSLGVSECERITHLHRRTNGRLGWWTTKVVLSHNWTAYGCRMPDDSVHWSIRCSYCGSEFPAGELDPCELDSAGDWLSHWLVRIVGIGCTVVLMLIAIIVWWSLKR